MFFIAQIAELKTCLEEMEAINYPIREKHNRNLNSNFFNNVLMYKIIYNIILVYKVNTVSARKAKSDGPTFIMPDINRKLTINNVR